MRGNNKKRAAVDPSCHLRARELSDSGTKTAAPNQVLQERVRTRGPSAEEAESRPFCGLILCKFLLVNGSLLQGIAFVSFQRKKEATFPQRFRLEYAPEGGRCQWRGGRENYPMQDEHEPGDVAGAVSNAR